MLVPAKPRWGWWPVDVVTCFGSAAVGRLPFHADADPDLVVANLTREGGERFRRWPTQRLPRADVEPSHVLRALDHASLQEPVKETFRLVSAHRSRCEEPVGRVVDRD